MSLAKWEVFGKMWGGLDELMPNHADEFQVSTFNFNSHLQIMPSN